MQDVANAPGLVALCAGYEASEWRAEQLASHIMEWIPEFALRQSELAVLGAGNAMRLMNKAAKAIYASANYQTRGEFGEILLHIVLRQCFQTVPAISKYYFKDSANDTVKGFDSVHIIAADEGLELWLGEVKFYEDIGDAIRRVVDELAEHSEREYLRGEFTAITNKVDDTWPYAERLKKMVDRNVSLDDIVARVCIPVLLTYDSPTMGSHKQVSKAFSAAFEKEVRGHYASFSGKKLPQNVRIHLLLIPLKSKKDLLERLDKKLKACQAML